MGPDILTKLPADFQPFAPGTQRDLGAVKDRITMVSDGDPIAPGISVIDTPGQTPGHVSVPVEGDGGLIVIGDAVPNGIISAGHPGWAFGFDSIPDMAIATRTRLLDRAAADGVRVPGHHFTHPGVGRIEKAGGSFRFVAEAA